MSSGRRIIVAITGASGAIYGMRFVRRAVDLGASVDLLVSAAGVRVWKDELGHDVSMFEERLEEWCGAAARRVRRVPVADIGAEAASGTAPYDGMAIVPCSMGTAGRVAAGSGSGLIERAADVTLKERRPLVLVPRETPLNRIHLENLLRLHDAGATIVPAMPAFYLGADTIDALVDTVVDRALSFLFGPEAIRERWRPEDRNP